MESTKHKLWTKDFLVVSLINFTITLIFYLLMVTIAGYAVEQFDASTSTAGLVSSIFIIGTLFGRLGTGRIIGDLGSKKTLFMGLLLFMLSTMSYFIALNLPLLMMNRLMQGIALGVASTATGTIIAQILPPERRGEGIGYYSLSAILATAIGPFIGILLTQLFEDYRMIFAVDSVLAVVCFMMYFMVTVPDAPKNTKRMAEKLGFKLSSFIELRALPIAFVALVIGFAYSGVMSFMTFYAKELHLVTAGSYFFIVYALVILATRPFTGKLLDARGANIIIYPCLILFAMGMYAFSTATSTVVFLIAAAFIGIGYGNFNSVAQAIAIKVTPHERLGLATSTYFILYDLGLGVGPYFLGLFAPTMGYSAIFLSMVAVIFVSIVLYYFLYGKYEKVKQVNI
ncbi:multidrug MFS transporter [Lysinibacillus sphaericus]|uniref:Galactose-proton symporter n=1 Tax=Lysinibacillus sphaericus TaxID=1421 RepID=A0A2S5D128_LYSSH|nr:MFS transporter [Lysinibacillus sphaericus]OEC03600.1 multidrug MFS transporter [Lysinibacillus sphaericus]POZ56764.1 Galactose-proton symporter [Lysinibacillus sphaericus]